jgi:hypothetical protein
MNAEELDRFVVETVQRSPETPREVDRGPLLVHCTLNVPSAVMIVAGVATLSIVSRFSFTGALAPGQEGTITAFHVVMGGLGIGLALLPLLVYARFVSVLRHGVLATARVVESQPVRRHAAAPDAPKDGVVGRRIVDHPTGPFEQSFRSDAGYAPALLPGVEMAVLVHPRKPMVLRDLHPIR